MKKIVTSVGMIVFVAALVAGGTGAFFSDTETSTGNIFTAGALDLTVDSESHYNGLVCTGNPGVWTAGPEFQNEDDNVPADHYPQPGDECGGTWELTDLEDGVHTFFDFADIKPGDEGENTISLHINNNPAWACVDITLTSNDDNTSTEPELDGTGDVEDVDEDLFDGELAQNVNFAAWLDQGVTPGWQGEDEGEGDNIWQGDEVEPLLFSNESGPASDVLDGVTYALADSENGFGPITPLETNYIGLAWCAGTQDVDTALNTITCDGSTLGNIVQTDSFEADIAFRVEQHRNNEDFLCNPREEEPEPVITRLTLEKSINQDETDPVDENLWTLTASSTNTATMISGTETSPAVSSAVVQPGTYVLTESDVAGFTQTGLVCGGNATPLAGNVLTIAAGEQVVCTFTNTENTILGPQ